MSDFLREPVVLLARALQHHVRALDGRHAEQRPEQGVECVRDARE